VLLPGVRVEEGHGKGKEEQVTVGELIEFLKLCELDSLVITEGCDCNCESIAVVVDEHSGETIIARTREEYDCDTDTYEEVLQNCTIHNRTIRRVS
jgi:hypothetical protein